MRRQIYFLDWIRFIFPSSARLPSCLTSHAPGMASASKSKAGKNLILQKEEKAQLVVYVVRQVGGMASSAQRTEQAFVLQTT